MPRLLLSVFLGIASSCSTVRLADTGALYAHNLSLEVNGKSLAGMGVAERAPKYKIKIRSAADMDFILISTCHRSLARENEGTGLDWEYIPTSPFEDSGACPVRMKGVEKDKGRQFTGYIDFSDPRKKLRAYLTCNGAAVTSDGVSTCQSALDLIQGIRFDVPVDYSTLQPHDPARTAVCNAFKPAGDRAYTFQVPRGECVVTFAEKEAPYKQHRLTLYGFDQYQAVEF